MSRTHNPRVMTMGPGANRGLKLLGLRVNDIAVGLFSNRETPHTSGGKITRSEFFGFWTQLPPEDAMQYLEEIIKQIFLAIESKGQLPHTNITVQSLINTAAFLLLSNGIAFDLSALAKIYANYFEQRNDAAIKAAQDSLPLRNLIRIFHARVNGERNHEFLAPLLVGASSFQPGTRLSEVIRIPTIDESDIQSNENGFIYPYLCELVEERGVDVQSAILHHIFDKVLSLSQVARMNFAAAEPTFLSLVFMLRNFLQSDAVSSAPFVQRGISVLQPLFLWPKPYSTLALQAIRLLQAELISPGYSRRQAVLRESRLIDYHLQQSNPDNNIGFYRYTKPIFYLFDSEDPTSTPILHILDTIPTATSSMVNFRFNETSSQDKRFEQNEMLLPHGILALMLLHAVHVDISLEQSDIDMVARLYPAQIVSLLKKLDAPVDEFLATQARGEPAKPFDRSAHLVSIHQEMIAMANKNASEISNPLFSYNIPSQRIRGNEAVPVTTPFLPFLPNVEHVRMPLLLRTRGTEHEKQGQYFPATFVVEKIHTMLVFLRDHIDQDEPQHEREIRFVVVGGDTLLQHVITTHYLLQTNHAEDLQGINIRWYLAPTTRNHLAYYIARYDLWYQRHVFCPLRSAALVVPWMKDTELDLKQAISSQDGGAVSQPTQYLRRLMTDYVQTAHNTLNVTIYVLEGRYDSANHEPDETIPFVQRVEVGLRPAAEEYRLSKGLRVPIEDIYRDKAFPYQSIDLNATYTKMDLLGNPRPDTIEENVPFNSILLSNVPRKGDPCNPPDPTGLGLELFSKVDRGKLKKNTTMDPRPHVLAVSFTSPSNTRFKVLVDGVLHGPYASVKVRVGNFNTNNPLQPPITAKFPVQTFFPIQLQAEDHKSKY